MIRPSCEDSYVVKKRRLGGSYFALTFGPYKQAQKCRPGSFLHIRIPSSDIYFRRAMSVASADSARQEVEIIFKLFGRGTSILSNYERGSPVDIFGPLGLPFKLPGKNERLIMVGGGIGFPPLLFLASYLISRGYDPRQIEFFYGGRTSDEIVERSRLRRLVVHFHPVTDDGSFGSKGMVTNAVEDFIIAHQLQQAHRSNRSNRRRKSEKLKLFGCGPEGMLRATDELGMRYGLSGQLSLEAPMPCGIGVCLGCVLPLRSGGYTRVCYDGPVYDIGEVMF